MKNEVKILDTPCDYLDEDIPKEIDFSDGNPNPFVQRKKVKVELEPDVADVFSNSNEVNNALRVLMRSAKKIKALL
ncbi:MAG: hypothetical protein A2X61_10070 [Ignavibacteria bacterium GWB2_35_12]|nr:MAG: hypothetical protein A2X63_06350 [Ignavibacteria bacterium GWA2_35_8]OGU39695.1 MAG: hypothetical protein A2X61_10070 [Ignavibacteria bacterium GWB2_35_12]OGU89542.1 MAG: hypothetical protein A2220_01940 [Ignavibacteria bacterium RIFOXYA2_FULL_35_10]OGV23890.1 MAG: hypothetical protein A2475_07260 [Ignavibacteria bacterium RIFOXYC2_FULL_35_21]